MSVMSIEGKCTVTIKCGYQIMVIPITAPTDITISVVPDQAISASDDPKPEAIMCMRGKHEYKATDNYTVGMIMENFDLMASGHFNVSKMYRWAKRVGVKATVEKGVILFKKEGMPELEDDSQLDDESIATEPETETPVVRRSRRLAARTPDTPLHAYSDLDEDGDDCPPLGTRIIEMLPVEADEDASYDTKDDCSENEI